MFTERRNPDMDIEKGKVVIRKADSGGFYVAWHPSEMATHSIIVADLEALFTRLRDILSG